jgi:hypothetical protein
VYDVYTYYIFVLGDVGGIMGLLLGGSALTVFELLDLVVFQLFESWLKRRHSDKQLRAIENRNNCDAAAANGNTGFSVSTDGVCR